MNIIVLSNTLKYPYHTQIIKALNTIFFTNGSNAQIINISDQTPMSELSRQLSSLPADIIITLDLAGFELRTLTGECLLNMLPCKVCNILWGNKSEYDKYLTGKLSLSMLFYDATGTDNQLPSKYPNMRYYYPTAQTISGAIDTQPTHETEVLETLQNTIVHFTKEVLLS
jgi:hypothetical protein